MSKVKICHIGISWKDNIPTIVANCRKVSYRETECYYMYDGNRKLSKLRNPTSIVFIVDRICFNAANDAYTIEASTKDVYRELLKSHYNLYYFYKDCAERRYNRTQENKYLSQYNHWSTRLENFEKAMKKFLNKYH